MRKVNFKLIHEDAYIIVAEKPPKVPSQGDPTGDVDMLTLLKDHLQTQHSGVKEPYLGLVHRLDRPVGGAMVFAKTKEANAFLSKQIQDKTFQKEYLVVACGKPEKPQGELRDYLLKLSSINMSKVVDNSKKSAKEGILEYQLIENIRDDAYGDLSLLRIILKTGRHHQIRVQLSHAQLPIWGDNKYNKTFIKTKEWTQIALWSYKLSFTHPKTKIRNIYISQPSKDIPFSLFNMSLDSV